MRFKFKGKIEKWQLVRDCCWEREREGANAFALVNNGNNF